MDSVTPYLSDAYGFVQGGFNSVNSQILALVIALGAAVLMKEWKKIWVVALGATVIQILVAAIVPVLSGATFKLPPLVTASFWMGAAATYIGLLIVIAVFFFVKKNVLKAA
ncbi:hypothetical protein [Caulobacter sp. 17J65-9]|uniref:hypothetical protein n=1 Tax=Caulobacter sp. 17J65-9 TaxID=2709382 RepID=UPI0013CABA7A|nr:hypothetical protein [Caulobacter sp. 17J65-9]NEX94829.1 hypothetical protein [Caulobacter sp. 17J65-9]